MATLEELMEAAAASVPRLDPVAAFEAAAAGAVLVDIRSVATRARDGVIPGSIHVNRTVLEWRLDPAGAHRSPHVPADARVVLLCDHGYSSLLSAATLREIGADATDVVGGFVAWREAGLPWAHIADPPLAADEPQGVRGPAKDA